jgi:hypothetical protein
LIDRAPGPRWSAEAWAQVRVAFRKALALRSEIRPALTLLADLEEFVRDHRPHGGMTGDAVACACGVVFER